MNIIMVAATEMEIKALRSTTFHNHDIQFAVHGAGMLNACFHIQNLCLQKPDMLIQCGIAGTYHDQFALGSCVIVASEQLGDCGAEDHDQMIDLFDLGFANPNEAPFVEGILPNPHISSNLHLAKVKGLSVNLCAGSEETINRRRRYYQPDIETMEGAALHYVGLATETPFLQFRGISNLVEPRNRNHWKIPEALSACHQAIIHYLQNLG
jgi:futalosine hydrolase